MAPPGEEQGFTPIANELLDALVRYPFTKRQYKVLLAVIRKTFGFHKPADDLTSPQLAAMTGLADTHCRAAVRELIALGVLIATPGRFRQVLALCTDWQTWATAPVPPGPGEDRNGPAGRTKTVHTKR